MRTSDRFRALPGYPLAGMNEIRRRVEASGVDVIDLGSGDPEIPPPPAAVEAIRRAAGDLALSRYAYQSGLEAFREAIAAWMGRRFGVEVDPATEVLPLIGSKEGIAHLPFAYVGPGDVAIIPDPGYRAYLGGVTLAGGDPYLARLGPENDFLIALGEVPEDVAARTRILYLNYPNNPTTAVAPDAYYEEAIRFCVDRGALLAHDHAYSEIAFDGYRPRSILELEGARDVAIEFHSMS
ncbi:MAG: aminotransferase class I/II-fold pyridoxal phosphate-dependent enzyme, partial [Gemmatimonadota bacterium]